MIRVVRIPALQRTQPRANTGRQISPFAGTAQGANNLCPQIGQNPPISGMRCPQWPHDFEPIALGFRLANHQTMNAIKANGTSRKSKTPSMTISSGKPMVRIGRSVSNFCKLGAPLLPPASFPPPQSFRLPDELLAHLPGTDGHLRACTRHTGAHAAVGLVALGFRRVV